MKAKVYILIIISGFILWNCNNSIDNNEYYFESPFPKREKNLWWKLGSQFSVIRDNDTITYNLTFKRDNRTNLIVNDKTKDTIFYGTVNKYRGLYYFNYQRNDSSFLISGIDIDKNIFNNHNTITDLRSTLFQIFYLADSLENGKYQKLITRVDSNKNIVWLKPDKKILDKFYSSIIDSIPRDTIIDIIKDSELKTVNWDTSQISESRENISSINGEEYGIIKKIYPNPINDYCILEIYQNGDYYFDLTTTSGKIIKRKRIDSDIERIDLTGIQSGIYILRVYPFDKKDVESVKIIKK